MTARPSRRAWAFWFGWFAFLNLLWLAFISAFDVAETVLGAVASAIAATAATVVREQGFVTFRPRARWLLGAWRLPGRVLRDTVVVFRALWRRLARGDPMRGAFHVEPFEPDPDETRWSAQRTIFAIETSIPPNAYVVGIDEEERCVVLHELVPTSPRRGR